jgi:hypothetical protein
MVTASAGDAGPRVPSRCVWRAVIERTPSARAVSPSVSTTVVVPVATALPISTPSA